MTGHRAGEGGRAACRGPDTGLRLAILGLLMLLALAGCRRARPTSAPTAAPAPARQQTPNPTPQPSPTTIPPTPAPSTQPTTPPPTTPLPTPLPVAADDLNVLLLGTDRRIKSGEGHPSWRTDTLIVVAIRPRSRLIAMLSIPRDLWVTIPGYGENRINVADHYGERDQGPGGGPALLGATLEENLGIPIDGYARIHFEGLERIVNALGGITITSDRAIDEWMDDASGEGLVHVQVVTGTQRMDGQTALGYARYRSDTSDLDRTRRQQEVLLALRDAALRPEVLPRLPGLLIALPDAVDTDLRPGQVLALLGLAVRLDPDSYRTRIFDKTMVQDWTTPEGAMVLLPDAYRIAEAWAELTSPPPESP